MVTNPLQVQKRPKPKQTQVICAIRGHLTVGTFLACNRRFVEPD